VSILPKECECDEVIMSVVWCGEKSVGVSVGVSFCCVVGKERGPATTITRMRLRKG
jgi:hypothetical protein